MEEADRLALEYVTAQHREARARVRAAALLGRLRRSCSSELRSALSAFEAAHEELSTAERESRASWSRLERILDP